jgi:hypothetical protein
MLARQNNIGSPKTRVGDLCRFQMRRDSESVRARADHDRIAVVTQNGDIQNVSSRRTLAAGRHAANARFNSPPWC